jgi:DNA-binding transcriptional ArsR family regulator
VSVFEGLLGNTSNLRAIAYLLSFPNAIINEKDLMEEVGVSKPAITKVIRKLAEFELIAKVEQKGNDTYYRVNRASPFVRLLGELGHLTAQHKYRPFGIDNEPPRIGIQRGPGTDPPTPH